MNLIPESNSFDHAELDRHGKANGVTITHAPWHPEPGYTYFKTGSLLSRNQEYPSGLVIIGSDGKPKPYSQ
jgi:hypothetical protein